MAAVSQTTSSSAFSWMKMFECRLEFQWSLFLRVQLTIFQHWFRSWFGAVQATSHCLNQWWLVYRRIFASLGLNELRHKFLVHVTDWILDYFLWNCSGMTMNPIDDKSTLAQVMAWCLNATSHYLNHCWPRSLASLGHNELTQYDLLNQYGLLTS